MDKNLFRFPNMCRETQRQLSRCVVVSEAGTEAATCASVLPPMVFGVWTNVLSLRLLDRRSAAEHAGRLMAG